MILLFFCRAEGPRDHPGGTLREVPLGPTEPAPVSIVFYPTLLQAYFGENNNDQAELSSGGPPFMTHSSWGINA